MYNLQRRHKKKLRLKKARENASKMHFTKKAKEVKETPTEKQKPADDEIDYVKERHIEFDGIHVKPTPSTSTKFPSNALMDKDIIPKIPFSMSILGTTGSGKTHLLSFMLNNKNFYRGMFDKIIVFGRTIDADHTYKFIRKDKVVKTNFVKEMDALVQKLDDESENVPFEERDNILIILEDISAEKKLLKSESLNRLFVTFRHYKASVITLSHYYKKLNPMIRLNVSALVIFPCNSTQLDILSEDYKIKSKDAFYDMCHHAFTPDESNARPFLLIQNNIRGQKKMSKCFDENLKLLE